MTEMFHGWPVDELDEFLNQVTSIKRRRPLRREVITASPRCRICKGWLSRGATRFVDGVEYHRACLGDK